MVLTIENILLVGSLLLFVSVIAGKTSFRFGIPTLILFLLIGMLAGSEGIARIHFDDPHTAQFIGIVCLNFILFSGGLDTNWSSTRPVLAQGITLSVVGVLLTALSLGTFVWYVTDFTLYEGFLLGSIVSSTDAAAVFSMLRSRSLALKNRLRPTLELESGSNDPMAYTLTVAFLGLVINEEMGLFSILPVFLKQMVIGGVAGLLFGYASKYIINHIKLDYEGLYSVLVIALMFTTFSATDFIGGNGFLAVYLCALFLGNQDIMHKNAILKMFDGLAWLMQIVLFVTLGLLVYPSEILPVMGVGLLISLFLIFVSRPLSVFLCLMPFSMSFRRRAYISWVGLRGAVPIVFATYPLIAGVEKASMIFNIVFFISLTSIVIQGTTLSVIARWLRVALPEKVKPRRETQFIPLETPRGAYREIPVARDDFAVGKKIVNLGLPGSTIISMIRRGDDYLIPGGATEIEENDVLCVLAESQHVISSAYQRLKKGSDVQNKDV